MNPDDDAARFLRGRVAFPPDNRPQFKVHRYTDLERVDGKPSSMPHKEGAATPKKSPAEGSPGANPRTCTAAGVVSAGGAISFPILASATSSGRPSRERGRRVGETKASR